MLISKDFKDLDIVVLMPFGSELYGTQVDIDDLNEEEKKESEKYISDKDFKGIYIPNKCDTFRGKIQKSILFNSKENQDEKNTSNDIDCEFYSIQYFFELAIKGDTSILDMLHCPDELLIKDSKFWQTIRGMRDKFYTKSLGTFVDYARGQAAKYGIKGSRLSDAKNVLDFLKRNISVHSEMDLDIRLRDVWNSLPEGRHIIKHPIDKTGLRMYEVCNRKLQETSKLKYSLDVIQRFYDEYGERAKLASENKGIDWKAISHALRAGLQLEELLTDGIITFPLKDAEFLKKVKLGRYAYFCVATYLDYMVDKLEDMNRNSSLPEKVDLDYVNRVLVEMVNFHFDDSKKNTLNEEIKMYTNDEVLILANFVLNNNTRDDEDFDDNEIVKCEYCRCQYCPYGIKPEEIIHRPDCPVLIAQDILTRNE